MSNKQFLSCLIAVSFIASCGKKAGSDENPQGLLQPKNADLRPDQQLQMVQNGKEVSGLNLNYIVDKSSSTFLSDASKIKEMVKFEQGKNLEVRFPSYADNGLAWSMASASNGISLLTTSTDKSQCGTRTTGCGVDVFVFSTAALTAGSYSIVMSATKSGSHEAQVTVTLDITITAGNAVQ